MGVHVTNENSNFVLRLFGLGIWLFGLYFFCQLVYIFYMGDFRHSNFVNQWEKADYLFRNGILLSGLIPLVVTGFFLIRFKSPGYFAIGLFIVTPLIIFLHYVFAMTMGHDDGSVGYYIFLGLELLSLLLLWVKRQTLFI